MAWNGVDFHLNTNFNWGPLESWALRWLDVEDQHHQDSDGLQGVIHSVTAPEIRGELAEFSVDFGSAPILAFEELLHVLQEVGATEVEVRSSCIE